MKYIINMVQRLQNLSPVQLYGFSSLKIYLSGVIPDMDREQKYLLLQELFDHATESIIVIDADGVIIMANPATELLFGFEGSEIIGKTVEHLIPERYAKAHVAHRSTYNENPHSRAMGIGFDLFARRKDGSEFPVEISLSSFRYHGKRVSIAFIIDITLRKQAEMEILRRQEEMKTINERLEIKVQDRTKVLQEALNEIEKSRSELREALENEKELNELKSRFLSMASHEFRTPLTTILSSATLISEYPEAEQQEKRIKHVERIQSAVNHLNDILSDFLSLSKIEEGKVLACYSVNNLKELVDEVVAEMRLISKDGQQIIHLHEGPEAVEFDPKLTRNIVINLLSNAIKYSKENQKVYIKTLVGPEHFLIEVRDEGMGISKEDQVHLFERFFRGHNAVNIKGTGLGLNIVAKYVELMDGNIEMDSDLNKGTTFRVSLPFIHKN